MADQTKIDVNEKALSPEEEEMSRSLEEEEKEMLRSLADASYKAPATPFIQRVTHLLRDDKAFTKYFIPSLVAIGPIHHDDRPDSKYRRAELAKRSLTARFLRESGTTKEALYIKVKRNLLLLKGSYDTEWKGDDDKKTALMFLVDGCAVLHFIHLDGIDKLNELGFKNDLLVFTKHDLFLLENQLPYKFLELLMGCCLTERAEELRKSIRKFIDSNAIRLTGATRKEKEIPEKPKEEEEEPHHLLGMLRKRLIREESKNEDSRGKINKFCHKILDRCVFDRRKKLHGHTYGHTFRNIHEIKQKGIMFGASDTASLKDISLRRKIHNFCMASLRLPSMIVDDSTGPKFMNLIAYEMCPHFQNNFEVSSFYRQKT